MPFRPSDTPSEHTLRARAFRKRRGGSAEDARRSRENVFLLCKGCNTLKADATPERLELLLRWMKTRSER